VRGRGARWVAIVVLVMIVAAWYAGLFAGLRSLAVALARRPDVADAFSDPLSGPTDALLMLVSIFLLTPVALAVVLGVVVFAVIVGLLVTEPVFRSVNLPSWIGVPFVVAGLGYGAWAIRGLWVPDLLYVAGLAAKAGLMFFSASATR
jgi:hypothetical protein